MAILIRSTVNKVAEDHTVEELMGMLAFLPMYTTTNRDLIVTPRIGTTIYNTTTNKLNFYNGSSWQAVTSA